MLSFFLFTKALSVCGQPWDFIKEKDGIKVFTRNEMNSTLKAFRGEIIFKADIDKVNLLVGDADNLDWWDKAISSKKIIGFEKNKYIKYYIVYDVPWPLNNRDLALEALISIDPVTGIRTVAAKPLLNVIPENKDMVRIKQYWQKWTVQPVKNGYVRVIMEGFVDPLGNVPDWLYNMTVTETPINVLNALRERALSSKPAK
jgi:hypothetical protein